MVAMDGNDFVDWGTATATPLSDLRAVKLLTAGYPVPFTSARAYIRARLMSDMVASMDDYVAASCGCCGWGRMSATFLGEPVPVSGGLFRTCYRARCPECGNTDVVYRDWREEEDE